MHLSDQSSGARIVELIVVAAGSYISIGHSYLALRVPTSEPTTERSVGGGHRSTKSGRFPLRARPGATAPSCTPRDQRPPHLRRSTPPDTSQGGLLPTAGGAGQFACGPKAAKSRFGNSARRRTHTADLCSNVAEVGHGSEVARQLATRDVPHAVRPSRQSKKGLFLKRPSCRVFVVLLPANREYPT